jgi:hypothetical protein
MPRTTIAAVLAMLLFLAPAASARPADVGYPAYPTPEVDETSAYSTKGNPNVGGLVHERESTSGFAAHGPAPADEDAPWLIVALGVAGAALGAGALTVVLRRNRTRARLAA